MTRWEDLGLRGKYRFDESTLDKDDLAIWRAFPADLRRVLAGSNGVELEDEHEFSTKIPFTRPTGEVLHQSSNWLTELWAFLPRSIAASDDGPNSILQEHFGRHVSEDFLPEGVYVFGRCEQNCLVAVSTNAADHGAIYYWEWYWTYPWYKPFFDARLSEARSRWAGRGRIDELHPDWPRLRDDFNYATLVQLAPSFDDWVSGWHPREEPADS